MKHSVKPIRVLLADHHALVRAGIRALLEKLRGVEVVGEVGDGRALLDSVGNLATDVVLMDMALPGLNSLETATRLTGEHPGVKIILLTTLHDEEYVWRAFRAGASGYLLMNAPAAELETAIRQVSAGGIYLSHEISSRLLMHFPWQGVARRKSPVERLTNRQREILQLIAEGHNTKGIAAMLALSPKTVEYHRSQLMEQLNIHDIAGLVRFALQTGLVSNELAPAFV